MKYTEIDGSHLWLMKLMKGKEVHLGNKQRLSYFIGLSKFSLVGWLKELVKKCK